jgi:cell division protein FtsI (penicillin-binding protein 3)
MSPNPQNRLWWATGVFAAALAVIAARLVDLQVLRPRHPAEFSGASPEYKQVRPSRRGAILDARGEALAISKLMVTIRADPKKLGPFSNEVSAMLSPALGLSAAEAAERLRPVPLKTTNVAARPRTAGGLTASVEERIRRNNGVATNVPVEAWEALSAALHEHRFLAETRLAEAHTNAVRALSKAKREHPWWKFRERAAAVAEASENLRKINKEKKAVDDAAKECRANGLYPEPVELRVYPREYHAAHVLGYTTNAPAKPGAGTSEPVALLGAAGLEQTCDRWLRGDNGLLLSARYGTNELVPLRKLDRPALDGLNVELNLDANIQSLVEEALDAAMETLKPKALSIIVVRPKDGAVLALANRPTFNPNTRNFPSLDALQNRAIMAPAEPGSTFKIVTYAAALDAGVVRLDTPVDCENGRWTPPGTRRPVNDDQSHHMGRTNVEGAFAHSSNVAASKIGLSLGTNKFREYMVKFGFLARTGIECAENGVMAKRDPKTGRTNLYAIHGETPGYAGHWDAVAASRIPYGYGFYASALQTCMAAAAIANDGVLMAPQLVKRITTSDGRVVQEFDPVKVRRVVKSATAQDMVKAMRHVVVGGTGKEAALADYAVCGKTGTSKKVDKLTGEYSTSLYYSSFVGFFPADAPEICIMINADEPTTTGKAYYGGKACAPIFQSLASRIAGYIGLPSDAARLVSDSSPAPDSTRPAPELAAKP